MCMYVSYVCMYVCVYVYTCIYMLCVYVCACACVYVCVCIMCMFVCIFVCVCVCMYACMYMYKASAPAVREAMTLEAFLHQLSHALGSLVNAEDELFRAGVLKALRSFEKSATIDPQNSLAWVHLARLEACNGCVSACGVALSPCLQWCAWADIGFVTLAGQLHCCLARLSLFCGQQANVPYRLALSLCVCHRQRGARDASA